MRRKRRRQVIRTRKSECGIRVCRIVFQHLAPADLITSAQVLNYSTVLFLDAETHLSSYESGSDVEAGVLGVGNPLLVNLHQLLDALQQFTFIKQLQRQKTRTLTHRSSSLLCFLHPRYCLRNTVGLETKQIVH